MGKARIFSARSRSRSTPEQEAEVYVFDNTGNKLSNVDVMPMRQKKDGFRENLTDHATRRQRSDARRQQRVRIDRRDDRRDNCDRRGGHRQRGDEWGSQRKDMSEADLNLLEMMFDKVLDKVDAVAEGRSDRRDDCERRGGHMQGRDEWGSQRKDMSEDDLNLLETMFDKVLDTVDAVAGVVSDSVTKRRERSERERALNQRRRSEARSRSRSSARASIISNKSAQRSTRDKRDRFTGHYSSP